MKKILTLLLVFVAFNEANAQSKGALKMPKAMKANDHFMLQLASNSWSGKPDSITTKGIGKAANVYAMMDYPFKSNKHFSAALGVGFGTNAVYLDKMIADITGTSTDLRFKKVDTVNHFKKYKVAAAYLEVPVELRWLQNPDNSDKSFKVAFGVKVGTLLSGYTKGKILQNKSGTDINKNIEKEKSKNYFNNTRIALTARMGWGHFSLFGQYQLTTTFKENIAPPVRPLSIGIALSGL
jgi:hypothetical protein